MYVLLGCVTYTQVPSLLLGMYFLNMAKPLSAAVSALWLHLAGDGVSFYLNASSPESHGAFALWIWRNTLWCLPETYFYHIFWCLPPFSSDITTVYLGPSSLRSCVLRSIPPSREGSYTSQPTSGTSGSWPEEVSPEDNWDVMIMTLKVPLFSGGKAEVPSAKCLKSGAFKASPSWVCLRPLLPAIHLLFLFKSLSWLSETPRLTTLWEQKSFKKWQDLQKRSKPVTDCFRIWL